MAPTTAPTAIQPGFELRIMSLTNSGRGFSFPCDAKGNVDLDAMSERTRNCYFGARALIGREYACPVVSPAMHAVAPRLDS